jgi:ATP-dependent DNA helicase RecQ
MDEKRILLKKHFGSDGFRPGQEEAINAILSGRDVFAVMPTGSGKSLCYQLPALMMSGLTLVVSPLISLMKDQVEALNARGIPAAYINSSLSYYDMQSVREDVKAGRCRLLYVSPERLSDKGFIRLAKSADISVVAVDEAHCISQWGHDFRPAYLRIAEFIDALPHRPVVGAFTATAAKRVKKDIIKLLRLDSPKMISTGYDRPNLYFSVIKCENKYQELERIIEGLNGELGIIYCQTRNSVESVFERLNARGYSVCKYHAGMSESDRRRNQNDFISGKTAIMAATCAFGMGIDKPDISFIIHMSMPSNLESYYQEVGRAGRDGRRAVCILLYSPRDPELVHWMIENSGTRGELSAREIKRERRLKQKRLSGMKAYCETGSCLRAYILRYFGERPRRRCRACSNCKPDWAILGKHDKN